MLQDIYTVNIFTCKTHLYGKMLQTRRHQVQRIFLHFQGCQEGEDPFEKLPHPWSAAHSDDYGYSRLTVHNASHLSIEQVSVDKVRHLTFSFLLPSFFSFCSYNFIFLFPSRLTTYACHFGFRCEKIKR